MARAVLALALASMLFGESETKSSRLPMVNSDLRTFRSSSTVVLVGANVRDRRQNLVTGLSAADFEVFDQGQRRPIKYFAEEQTPISLLLIYDASASMSSYARESARIARHLLAGSNQDDEFALISFSGAKRAQIPWTESDGEILGSLVNAPSQGSTGLFDAVSGGLEYMKTATRARKIMVVISDGEDNDSRLTARELIGKLAESDVEVYSMVPESFDPAFRLSEGTLRPSTQLAVLEEICSRTGGVLYSTSSNADSLAAAEEISKLVRSRYVLGFEVPEQVVDGRFHRLRVTVQSDGHRAWRVIARRGYRAVDLN